MTNRTEKTYRVADITAKDIKRAIEEQGAHSTPDPGMYYHAYVFAQSEDEREDFSKNWSKTDFYDCPEVRKWLIDGGAADESVWETFERFDAFLEEVDDIVDHIDSDEELWEAFERSATYLKGLEDIVDDIKKYFAPDAIVTLE